MSLPDEHWTLDEKVPENKYYNAKFSSADDRGYVEIQYYPIEDPINDPVVIGDQMFNDAELVWTANRLDELIAQRGLTK